MKKTMFCILFAVMILAVMATFLNPLLPSKPAHNRTMIDRGEDYDPEELVCGVIPGSKVICADFVHDGYRERLSPKDPRLVWLLGYLKYAFAAGRTEWIRGFLTQENILDYIDPEQPYIDIFMETTATNYQELMRSQHLYVTENVYLDFFIYPEFGGLVAEWYNPMGFKMLEKAGFTRPTAG